jgi:hypothetical protein
VYLFYTAITKHVKHKIFSLDLGGCCGDTWTA